MPFRYERFDDIPIPDLGAQHDVGTGRVDIPASALVSGGSYVAPGRKPMQAGSFDARGMLIENNPTTMRQKELQLRALVGKRGKLWRVWTDGTREWTYATVRQQPASRASRESNSAVEQTLTLFVEHPMWYSETEHVLRLTDFYDASEADLLLMGAAAITPGSPVTVTIDHDGAIEGYSMTFRVIGGTGTVSVFEVENITTDYAFAWAGSLPSGQVLEVATGGQRVTRDGFGHYANFTPPTNHSAWMELAPGINIFNITLVDTATDDSTAIELRWYDHNP